MTGFQPITALMLGVPSLVAKDAEIAVKEIRDVIGGALVRGDRVEIRGFRSIGLS